MIRHQSCISTLPTLCHNHTIFLDFVISYSSDQSILFFGGIIHIMSEVFRWSYVVIMSFICDSLMNGAFDVWLFECSIPNMYSMKAMLKVFGIKIDSSVCWVLTCFQQISYLSDYCLNFMNIIIDYRIRIIFEFRMLMFEGLSFIVR